MADGALDGPGRTPRTRTHPTLPRRGHAGDAESAECDANDALKLAASVGPCLWMPDILECLASLAAGEGQSTDAVRLFGAADAARVRMKVVPRVNRAIVDSSLTMLQEGLVDSKFDAAWAEGAALSTRQVGGSH